MEKNDLISIIVPVFNVEKYLKKCVDSIMDQTYQNFEVILVNDGSTDQSLNICSEYAQKDTRVKVINKINGGLSDARNIGIENATGKYITFIDSDDFIKRDYLEYLYYLIKKYNTKISICAYSVLMESGKEINYGIGYCEKKMDLKESYRRMLNEEGFSVSAWAKLYETKLFENIRYPKGMLCEDNGTTYKILAKEKWIAYGNESKYYYLKRNGSIMLSSFNIKKLDMIILTDEMCSFIEECENELKECAERRRVYARFNILRQIINTENHEIENEIIKFIVKRKNKILKGKEYSIRDKFALICLLINKKFFGLIWKIYSKLKY